MFYAHSANKLQEWNPLKEHLELVAKRAGSYAKVWDAEAEAQWLGLLHDLGKLSELFQRRLQGKESRLDHWSIGAWTAQQKLKENSLAVVWAIHGHHLGLQKRSHLSGRLMTDVTGKRSDGRRTTAADPEEALRLLVEEGLTLPESFTSTVDPNASPLAQMLDIRMLFSCLVDADYTETAAHFDAREKGRRHYPPDGPRLDVEKALSLLEAKLSHLATNPDEAATHVHRMRTNLRRECEEGADHSTGLFTLTAPTGSGKTLSMLAFALRHARKHKLRRIVMVIPYLTLIEQTTKEYRQLFDEAFGPHYVLEHHSLTESRQVDKEKESNQDKKDDDENDPKDRAFARLLAENYDAPLILTTNVQLLHSLFANRPRVCRKLHRLARSVILFDEVQTLPQGLAVPTLAALSHLAERYGSSIVFSTATQPAFEELHKAVSRWVPTGWRPKEVVKSSAQLFEAAGRTQVHWNCFQATPWLKLADQIAEQPQVLTIVNLKRHARNLVKDLQHRGIKNLYHLSTSLCPKHREKVLAEVRQSLEDGEPCCLVATQCVEAGVDIDFPTVFRALAPLEAIAQAAGRCNRRGKEDLGDVFVFLPEDDGKILYPPGGGYANAAEITLSLLLNAPEKELDIEKPETFRKYYKKLYGLTKAQDALPCLRKAIEDMDFPKVSECYRVIDEDTIQVVVPYDPETFSQLRKSARSQGLSREWVAQARPHAVNVYRLRSDASRVRDEPVRLKSGKESGDWFFLGEEEAYCRDLLGLES